ncbi:acetyl-CoA synthetase-like protein [Thelephora ganbajun]|uniref:Acetyl-CoA synthetase-like protein n=1 Tax=Thelephora ganbajun TaxID=370292 RepID=A0ACB6ZVK5_THEGA|nr:acetyl-CoA synthetase-like protein [Thelephora ganbajun]
MPLSSYVVTDDLTVLLGLSAAALFLLQNLYKPQPLIHPILLGRQSDVAPVRNPRESAVYRNYSTSAMGRLPLRPAAGIQTVLDLVRADVDSPRTLWSTKITNTQLLARVKACASGIDKLGKFQAGESKVLFLLNDGLDFLIADLAFAAKSITTMTISSPELLAKVLDNHPPSAIITDVVFLPHIVEQIYDIDQHHHTTVIVVGDPGSVGAKLAKEMDLLKFSDIEKEGASDPVDLSPPTDVNHVFTIAFSKTPSGTGFQAVQFTQQNLTAGVAATRSLLPVSSPFTPLDTIVSAFSLSTPYGRTIAYTAVYEGTCLATLNSAQIFTGNEGVRLDAPGALEDINSSSTFPIPSPTILFVKPEHVISLTSSILNASSSGSWLSGWGWRHKVAHAIEGFITKESLWDRFVFDAARVKVLGEGAGTLRALIATGGYTPAETLTPARIAFSIPYVNAVSSDLACGPLFASYPHDLQIHPSSEEGGEFENIAHVGAPTISLEVKLVSVDDVAIEEGKDPIGEVYVRGPPAGTLLGENNQKGENWLPTGYRGKVQPNGCFKVVPQNK